MKILFSSLFEDHFLFKSDSVNQLFYESSYCLTIGRFVAQLLCKPMGQIPVPHSSCWTISQS